MNTRIANLTVGLAVFLCCSQASAVIYCADVTYGKDNYHDNMRKLALQTNIKDGEFTRYHEDLKSAICAGKLTEVKKAIDMGFVTAAEADAFRRNLSREQPRSEMGKSYAYYREKFSEMGRCSACADNVAQHYTRTPNLRCGKLAKQALEGNPQAVAELRGFPEYCKWQY